MKQTIHPQPAQAGTASHCSTAPRSLKSRARGPRLPDASREAKRVAAMLLEVLAGAVTPTAAADTLGVSLPRFYLLEQRAIQAFVTACEPRTGGRTLAPARELDLLRKQIDRLQRECTRNQTLLRLAQRTIGLAPVAQTGKDKGPGKFKRKRRPAARALVAARSLRANDDAAAAAAAATGLQHGDSSMQHTPNTLGGQTPDNP